MQPKNAIGLIQTVGDLVSQELFCLLPRDAMLARYMLSSCVRLSVRPSHTGIV